jgi:glycerol-3-phosphate dehydrogenase
VISFVVPNYEWCSAFLWAWPEAATSWLANMASGKSRLLSREETLEQLPTLKTDGLKRRAVATTTGN